MWTSSNADILSVEQEGKASVTRNGPKTGWFGRETSEADSVKLVGGRPGKATLTCTLTYGDKTYTKSREVTVLDSKDERILTLAKNWRSAYEEYKKTLEKYLIGVSAADNTASYEQMGEALMEADKPKPGKTTGPIICFIEMNLGNDPETVKKYVYMGIARYLVQNADTSGFGFGSLSVEDLKSLPASIVRAALGPMQTVNESYSDFSGGKTVSLHGQDPGIKNLEIRYDGKPVATLVSNLDECKTVVAEFINELIKLEKNLLNQAFKEVLKEIFSADVSKLLDEKVQTVLKGKLDN